MVVLFVAALEFVAVRSQCPLEVIPVTVTLSEVAAVVVSLVGITNPTGPDASGKVYVRFAVLLWTSYPQVVFEVVLLGRQSLWSE